MEFFRPDSNYNFMGKSKLFLGLSTLFTVVSIAAVGAFGLNYGIDFAGGYELQTKFDKPVTEAELNDILGPLNLGDFRVQRFGDADQNEYLILVREHGTMTDADKQSLKTDLQNLAGGADNLADFAIAESGEMLRAVFKNPVTEDQLRGVFGKYNLNVKRVSTNDRQDQPEFKVEFVSLSDKINTTLHDKLGIPADQQIISRVEFVGPQVGEQLRSQGIAAVAYALFFILIYVAFRFDFFFAPAAIVALFHDVAVTLGVFAIFQLEFNLPAIAAILTLIGYSLNDTIVVYDRVRENLGKLRGKGLVDLVNVSINQTLSRTVLTGGSTILVIGAMLAFGGQTIRDFAIALLVGIITGTWSSIAIASPLYVWFRQRYGATTQKSGSTVAA